MRCLLSLALLLMPVAPAQTPSSPTTLAQLQDHYREVLIFAPTTDPRLRQQVESLSAHCEELIERQIMLVPFFHKYAGLVDGAIMNFLNQEEPALRKRFQVKETDFIVILIGKDGGEKLRSHQPLSFEKLRDTVDSMPMRRDEMHKSDHSR